MTKFINAAKNVAEEALEGFLLAYGKGLSRLGASLTLVKTQIPERVVVVTGGGSGHEPGWLEYIGDGFADAIVQGDIFAAPSPNRIVEASKEIQKGKGVLFVYANYSGDKMNFDMAADDLEEAGIPVRTVRSCDDVAGAPWDRRRDRRGIAGGFFASKIAGAAVAEGYDLESAADVADRAAMSTRSIGVASQGGTVPGSGEPTFTLPPGRMEIGLGMHGEQGVRQSTLLPADATVDLMIDHILDDAKDLPLKEVCVLVNGLGATTRGELFIAYRRAHQRLSEKGISIHDVIIAEVTTSQEMQGFSISLFALDDELKRLYDRPCRASFYNK